MATSSRGHHGRQGTGDALPMSDRLPDSRNAPIKYPCLRNILDAGCIRNDCCKRANARRGRNRVDIQRRVKSPFKREANIHVLDRIPEWCVYHGGLWPKITSRDFQHFGYKRDYCLDLRVLHRCFFRRAYGHPRTCPQAQTHEYHRSPRPAGSFLME